MSDDIDMTEDEAVRIDGLVDLFSYLSDGAFWAALEDEGVYPEDVEAAQELLEKLYS